MSPAILDSGSASRVTPPVPWTRFSRLTWAASPPLAGKRRAVRHCSTLITSERSRLTSILTVGEISPSGYGSVGASWVKGWSKLGGIALRRHSIPLLPEGNSFLERSS
jgi:hypothetical protein